MHLRITISIATLALCTVATTSAANPERAIEPPIDASMIEAHTAEFDITLVDTDGNEKSGGRWTDEVKLQESEIVRTVVRYSDGDNADLVRTIVADRTDLKPLLLDQRFGPNLSGVMRVDFQGNQADQILVREPTATAIRIDAEFDREVWELSLWGTLAMSLPFEAGREFQIPTVGPDRKSVRDVTFRIEAIEEVSVGSEILTAAKVSVPEENWVFWVRKEAPYIVRITHPAPGGLVAVSTLAPAD